MKRVDGNILSFFSTFLCFLYLSYLRERFTNIPQGRFYKLYTLGAIIWVNYAACSFSDEATDMILQL